MVAFKCVANNKYLRVPEGFAPPVQMGEKMWWKMGSNGVHVPGAFNLSVPTRPERPYLECHDVAWNSTGVYIGMMDFRVCLSLLFAMHTSDIVLTGS